MSQQADIYKTQGNAALLSGQYAEAVELYGKAIALEPSCEIYFSNRAAAYAGLERWRESLDDSHEVVTLKPSWVKGWVRRGAAFSGLGQHEEARKAYLKATQLEPANAQIREKMEAAEKEAEKARAKDGDGKRWEDDLWSDDEEESGARGGAASAAGAAAGSAATSAAKRAAPAADGGVGGGAAKRQRTKPSPALLAQLDRSLKDGSEDTLRACLSQIASADETMCERVLQLLEGLNAASSAGSEDEDDEGDGGQQSVAAWLRGGKGGAVDPAGGGNRRRRSRRDDDSD